MMVSPTVSILVPVYNGANYLGMLINCLSDQIMTDFEVIFVDDHSTDESQQIIEQQSNLDNRFKILKMPQKGGIQLKVLSMVYLIVRVNFSFI